MYLISSFFDLLLVVACCQAASNTHIITSSNFISFVSNVNSGTSYEGTTVFLDSDLDFTGKSFEPIGNNWSYCFKGTFDGQGHTISNLEMVSSSQHVGLFGYSDGLIIRNLVLDDSCSFVSSHFSSSTSHEYYFNVYVGGIIGYCQLNPKEFIVESCVSMASVTFNGTMYANELGIGGIVGGVYSYFQSDYSPSIKNCANYGLVANYGENVNGYSYVGGIIGKFDRYLNDMNVIKINNCINYGEVSYKGQKTTRNIHYVGGIIGYSETCSIENCVVAGAISIYNDYIFSGAIIGIAKYSVNLTNSFWTSDTGHITPCGSGNTISYGASRITPNLEIINEMNEYASGNSWNRWLLNMANSSVSFKIKGCKAFAFSSQIILLPDFADNDIHPFSGWYSDENMTTPFMSNEIEKDTTLYGMFCEHGITVTLDVNGGIELAEDNIIILCNETYEGLPVPGRTGYTFDGWFTEADGGDKVEPTSKVTNLNNHTLYAHWAINQYVVTFILDNGIEPLVRTLKFNASIVYPKDVQREGYTFNGWDKTIEFIPAENITITAQWSINQYVVTFIFDNGTEPEMRTLEFNATIEYPKNLKKDGYTFNGWDKIVDFMPASDLTITAQWTNKKTEFVEIVFGKKDMSEEEAKVFIKGYTNAEFTITKYEENGSGTYGLSSNSMTLKKLRNSLRRSASQARRVLSRVFPSTLKALAHFRLRFTHYSHFCVCEHLTSYWHDTGHCMNSLFI